MSADVKVATEDDNLLDWLRIVSNVSIKTLNMRSFRVSSGFFDTINMAMKKDFLVYQVTPHALLPLRHLQTLQRERQHLHGLITAL